MTHRQPHSSLTSIFLLGFSLLALVIIATDAAAQTVTTPGGTFPSETYVGAVVNGTTDFLGIRYAAAPVGDLRFAAPTPPSAVSGAIVATQFGSSCPQTPSPFGKASVDEDCLFLNIFVPNPPVSSSNQFPVMVFFHGGAFVFGEGSDYDASPLAIQGNVIVVTINYRLGILGYLADTALDAQSATGASGNYGLADQQFALQWVRQNISAFGGDSEKVTIFGESAGGFSVCANVVSPSSAGLFARAITESGPCSSALPTKSEAEAEGASIAAALGCSQSSSAAVVSCLRALTVPQMLTVQNAITSQSSIASLTAFFPNVDGVLIPQEPVLSLLFGQFNHVPLLMGTNHDEGRLFIAIDFDLNPLAGPLTAAEYPTAVAAIAAAAVAEGGSSDPQLIAKITGEILKEYQLSHYSSPDLALSAVFSDSAFSCPSHLALELTSLQVPAFGYEFNDERAPMAFLPPVTFPYGATHTDELQFLFPFGTNLNAGEQKLATTMKEYWTTFAANGDPNVAGQPYWPPFSIFFDDDQSLKPAEPNVEFNFASAHKCNFWTAVLLQTSLPEIADQLRNRDVIRR
jgi:para-nitrobenzyl esterase